MTHELWCCPVDGTPLHVRPDRLECAACERRYPADEHVVRLMADEASVEHAGRPLEPLAELERRLSAGTLDDAVRAFCESAHCRRTIHGADWKLLLPVAAESTVLEIGPGFGDTTIDLARRARRVIVLAPHVTAATILARHTTESALDNVAIGVLTRLERIPIGDGSCSAVVVSQSAARAFGVERRGLRSLAAELRRVCRPGAVVLVGQGNPLHRAPGAAALRGRLQSGSRRSLDGVLRDAAISGGRGGWGAGSVVGAMREQGFSEPGVFAPIPDEERAEAILPVHDKSVVGYFLDNLVRRNAPLTRAALTAAKPLVRLGLFPHLVPYWFLVFRVAESGDRD